MKIFECSTCLIGHKPYEITKVFPGLIENFTRVHVWEESGLLDGLEGKEKFELAILLEEAARCIVYKYCDPKNEDFLDDERGNMLFALVIRLYRRSRVNDFQLVRREFIKTMSYSTNIIEEIRDSCYSSINAEAELIAITCEQIETSLGIVYEEKF